MQFSASRSRKSTSIAVTEVFFPCDTQTTHSSRFASRAWRGGADFKSEFSPISRNSNLFVVLVTRAKGFVQGGAKLKRIRSDLRRFQLEKLPLKLLSSRPGSVVHFQVFSSPCSGLFEISGEHTSPWNHPLYW